MGLERKDSFVAKCPENLLCALKTGQNEKFHIFQEIDILEINVQLFENFQNLIAFRG